MRLRPLSILFPVGLLTAAVFVPAQEPAQACATVFEDAAADVRVVGEEALIVWDPATRTEHFVRSARFVGATEGFGFLVPTPTRPELGEVNPYVFEWLYNIYRRPPQRSRERAARGGGRSREVDDPWVDVIERRTVAGLDTAVLATNDAGALTAWLASHRYPSSPALERWLAPYVARAFIITAFRYPGAGSAGRLGSTAVRMSFRTDEPFFPYSEPSNSHRPRPFRVSVVAPERMQARVGSRRWRGRVVYAGQPGALLARALSGVVGSSAFGEGSWLTTFDEPRSRRGRDDLYFETASTQRPRRGTLTTAIELGDAAPTPQRGGGREVLDPF